MVVQVMLKRFDVVWSRFLANPQCPIWEAITGDFFVDEASLAVLLTLVGSKLSLKARHKVAISLRLGDGHSSPSTAMIEGVVTLLAGVGFFCVQLTAIKCREHLCKTTVTYVT